MSEKRIYHYGAWVAHRHDSNYLGKLLKCDGKWVLEYRFRYFVDDESFESDDIKNWYSVTAKDDSDESRDSLLGVINHVHKALPLGGYGPVEFIDLQCFEGDPKMVFELGGRDDTDLRIGTATR